MDGGRFAARIRRLLRAVRGDERERFALLLRLARSKLPGYPLTWPDIDWFTNDAFAEYLEPFGENDGLNKHRRWNMAELLRLTSDIPGDTAECGVYLGAGSFLIAQMNAIADSGRTHYAIDSYEGLSEPGAEDGDHWEQGVFATPVDAVRNAFGDVGGVQFVKGWIPQVLDTLSDTSYSFVHVDVDLYQPTAASVAYFWPRLAPGGVLLCDDYGIGTCPGATKALDEYFDGLAEAPIRLAAGGAFAIKGVASGGPLF